MPRSETKRSVFVQTIHEYVDFHHGGVLTEFAHSQGVSKQAVNGWIKKGFMIFDNRLYSPRRVFRDTSQRRIYVQSIYEYADKFHNGSLSEFARHVGVTRQKVNEWINQRYLIFNDRIYSIRRTLYDAPVKLTA